MGKYVKYFKNWFHLIISSICITLWIIFHLIFFFEGFNIDFSIFYNAGKRVLNDPKDLYTEGYLYTPFFAMVFSISISLLPPMVAYFIWYIFNYILAIFMLLEFNKILALKGINKKLYRLFYLIILSNGWSIYYQFYLNQNKLIIVYLLLLILRMEIEIRKNIRKKDLRYRVIIYTFFIIIISLAPYFIFIIFIYLFYDIRLKELFKSESAKIYFIIIILFFSFNILFIVFPTLVIDFIQYAVSLSGNLDPLNFFFYFKQLIPNELDFILTIISTLLVSLTTIILILNNKLELEDKYGYFMFFYLLFSIFMRTTIIIIIIACILILYINHLAMEKNFKKFIKSNFWVILGFIAIIGLCFNYDYEKFFTFIPLKIIFYLRYVIILSILSFSLFFLKYKKQK
jgi:hypothetical protein